MYSYHFVISMKNWSMDGVVKVTFKVTDYPSYKRFKEILFKEFENDFVLANVKSASEVQITSFSLIA